MRTRAGARGGTGAPPKRLRIVSWNINSIRIRLDNLARLLETLSPHVVCLQETKVQDAHFPFEAVRELGFPHVHVRGTKGYSGVAILSRIPLTPVRQRNWCGRDDGRHIAARLGTPGGDIELHNFYVPAGGDVPDPDVNEKFAHKLRFLEEMKRWSARRCRPGRLVLVGDLNVAPLETDVWSHKQLLRVVSHTPAEVERLNRVMAAHGWVDAVRRHIPPERRLYTWWSYRARDWEKSDRGRRLDHIWVSPALAPALVRAQVQRDARGWPRASDHVPVAVTLRTDRAPTGGPSRPSDGRPERAAPTRRPVQGTRR